MIKSFRNKGLQAYWDQGDARKLPVRNHARVTRVLRALHRAIRPEDMTVAGHKFHVLNTTPQRWSVWVTGNCHITFAWDDGPVDIDIEDYH